APGGIQSTGQSKRVVFDFIDTWAGHHAADLRLFAKRHQVGQNVEMFATPVATSRAHAALHLVKNEQDVVLVGNFSQLLQPFAAKMIVAALALDRLDDDGTNVDFALRDNVTNLALGLLFPLDHIRFALR